MITDEQVARINALARMSRTAEAPTESEQPEQAALRRAYVDAVKASLRANLDSTYILEPDGTKHRLPRKD